MPPAYIPDESHGRTFDGIESTYGILPPTPEQIGNDDVMEECSAECSPYEEVPRQLLTLSALFLMRRF